MKETYPVDARFAGKAGRYTTKLITAAATTDGSTLVVPGNGNRVALILASRWDAAVLGDSARIYPPGGTQPAIVATVCPETPNARISLETHGDIVLGKFVCDASGAINRLSIYEVEWEPF